MNSSCDPSVQTPEQILSNLQVDPARGLGQAEIATRTARYGPNALEETKTSPWKQFLGYFWGPLPWIVEAPAIMALIIQDWVDFAIITFMLIFNAVLGFWEERAASNALDSLKNSLALKARALRDAVWGDIAAKDLLPGDIVRIRLGDVIPADGVLSRRRGLPECGPGRTHRRVPRCCQEARGRSLFGFGGEDGGNDHGCDGNWLPDLFRAHSASRGLCGLQIPLSGSGGWHWEFPDYSDGDAGCHSCD